jgi:hypothetical protein
LQVLISKLPVDRLFHEPVGIPVFADQLPLRRTAGRLDWRLRGLLSRMLLEEILCPGPPFLLARSPKSAFPAVMVFWAGEFQNLSLKEIAKWTEWASCTMAQAGAKFFSLAAWDLFDESRPISEFASKVLEGLHLGLAGPEQSMARGVRLVWEPKSAELFLQELRRARHRHSSLEAWKIAMGESFTEDIAPKSP